ncbi:cytochrome d ubiquinol oxidase subunit II, partial [Leptospira borgpetersenii serovar Hardjo-bovis]|nr:cytochrome d ubiquinol oxidase subunit II [Leptospira borgpetersenii serovar Hardjo-bovis]
VYKRQVTGRTFSGSALDWLTPFNLFCGVGLVVAYALLGASWIVMKSENQLHQNMRRLARSLLVALLAVIVIISAWTPLAHQAVSDRWFTLPNLWFLLPVPVLVALSSLGLWIKLADLECHTLPFVLTLGVIFLGVRGFGRSI